MLDGGIVPPQLQQAYVIPIHKKGKDPMSTDNYRGISITPIINKVFEHIITQKIEPLFNQNGLQFGFTRGKSPALAILTVTEAIAEAQDLRVPIYMMALDVKKAFDTVDHKSLMRKHFNQGMDPNTWTCLRQNLETNAQVKVRGKLGDSFPIKQGVGQGKITSTHCYKTYVNDHIDDLVDSDAGMVIGTIRLSAPYCADDAFFLALTLCGLQAMLYMAEGYASRERYNIHPQKCQGLALGTAVKPTVTVCGKEIGCTDSITHLGITRYRDTRGRLSLDDTIIDRVSLANRTAYAMMGAGLHGTNGLSPAVTMQMYTAYVLPRLLYGMECLTLLLKHIKMLNEAHRLTVRQLQGLPPRTAVCAVHLLAGTPPAEAILDKAIAGTAYSIGQDKESPIYHLAVQQLATKDRSSHSWFIYAQARLDRYGVELSDLIKRRIPAKAAKRKITVHWEESMRQEAATKPSLRYLNAEDCSLSQPHRIWKSTQYSLQGTKHSLIRVRLLLGVYTLQANRATFNQHQVDATCKMCGQGPEDREHFLLLCQALSEARAPALQPIINSVPGWHLLSRTTMVQILLDHTRETMATAVNKCQSPTLDEHIGRLVYRLHAIRSKLLNIRTR